MSLVVDDKGYDSEDNHTLWGNFSIHLVLYHLDIDMYQHDRHMEDTENSWSVATTPRYYTIRETKMKPYFQS